MCFFVSCNNVLFHNGYVIISNEAFFCKKSLNEFSKTFIAIYFLFSESFKYFLKDSLRNDTHNFFLFLICQYILSKRILIHLVFQFASSPFGYKWRMEAS